MIGPELFIDRLWLNDEDVTGGVQIIELKSSDSSDTSKDKDDQDNAQKSNEDQFQINDPSRINTNAREKRRFKNQSETQNSNHFEENNLNYSMFDSTYDNNNFYKEFYSSGNNNEENIVVNHQMNCFTILDKHYTVISENSSEDDFGNIEVIDSDNLPPEYTLNSCTREADRVSCDVEADIEKRMVWIYSFKNKRLLSDNDFELVNIPSQDLSTTETFIEHLPELNNLDRNCRVATPIPPTFVPRLNLTMTSTLPTVAEVLEPSEQMLPPQPTTEIPNDEVKRKPVNNWFSSENARLSSKKENCIGMEESSNVVDWMALSPRQKRRHLISSSWSCSPCKSQLPISCEINSNKDNVNFMDTNLFSEHNLYNSGNEKRTSIIEETTDTPKQKNCTSSQKSYTPKQQPDASRLKTDAPIQKNNTPKRKTCTPTKQTGNNKAFTQKNDNADLVRTVRSMSSTPPASSTRRDLHYSQITTIEIGSDQQDTPEDRGDYIKRPQTKRPQIRIRPRVPGSAISNPIENLNSNDWIIETSTEINDNSEKPRWPKDHGDGVGNVIFMKHMSLFKPAEWEAYLPITESVPSLSLSVNTDSERNSQSWLKRFQKIFSCCK